MNNILEFNACALEKIGCSIDTNISCWYAKKKFYKELGKMVEIPAELEEYIENINIDYKETVINQKYLIANVLYKLNISLDKAKEMIKDKNLYNHLYFYNEDVSGIENVMFYKPRENSYISNFLYLILDEDCYKKISDKFIIKEHYSLFKINKSLESLLSLAACFIDKKELMNMKNWDDLADLFNGLIINYNEKNYYDETSVNDNFLNQMVNTKIYKLILKKVNSLFNGDNLYKIKKTIQMIPRDNVFYNLIFALKTNQLEAFIKESKMDFQDFMTTNHYIMNTQNWYRLFEIKNDYNSKARGIEQLTLF